jgi:hypothetical protein
VRIFRNKKKRTAFEPKRETARGDRVSEYEIHGFLFFIKFY